MTQNYVNGFFTKCAECRVPYDLAVALYKRAEGEKLRTGPAIRPMGPVKGPVSKPFIKLLPEAAKRLNNWSKAVEAARAKRTQKPQVEPGAVYAAARRGGDIHAPLSDSDLESSFMIENREGTPDEKAKANFAVQYGIDSLPDPGPGVRTPTAYELNNFFAAQRENPSAAEKLEGSAPAGSNLSIKDKFFADKALRDELLRRQWNFATSAVPIKAVSPAPVRR